MDLTEISALNFEDVWAGNQNKITLLSKRYGADVALVVQMTQIADGQWQGKWLLYENSQYHDLGSTSGELSKVLSDGFDSMAKTLLTQYNYHAGPDVQQKLILKISKVSSINYYHRVLTYLNDLDAVHDADILSIGPEDIIVEAKLHTDVNHFNEALQSGHVLKLMSSIDMTHADIPTLRYQLKS